MSKRYKRTIGVATAQIEAYGECLPPSARAVYEALSELPMSTEDVARKARVSNSYARACLTKMWGERVVGRDVLRNGCYFRYEWHTSYLPF